MTAYDYIRFPAFKLASGRWVKLDMGTQWLRPAPAAPYQGTPVDMEVNPWARGGLPQPEDSCAPDEGSFGIDSAEIVFHNVPIKPSVDDTTLEELLSSVKPEQQCWNIRMWSTTTTTLVLGVETPVFATKPDFWGVVESSEISGDLHTYDKTWNTYKIAAKNPLSLLERVSPDTWLNGTAHVGGSYLPHATYDITPTGGVIIDGYQLAQVCFADVEGGNRNVWKLYTTASHNPGPGGVRMFRLVDVLYTIGTAIGISRPVNDSTGASSQGAVPSTWEYIDIDLTAGGHPETSWDFDDLVVWASLYHWDGTQNVHDQKWTFFDNAKLAPVSVMTHTDMLAVLKKFLFAHGLTARVSVNASGQQYLEVREVELASIAAAPSGDILRGISLDEGEAAAFGFSVVTANNGELSEGDGGDKSIDQPYMGATRLREGARWDYPPGTYDTDDMECLYASLYVYDAATSKAKSVYKIIPKRDGVERVTASPFMPGAPGDPGVAPDTGSLPAGSSFETRAHEAGSVVAKAAISYYWNGEADPETDPVGIYRRYTKKLTWKETGIKDIIVGSMRTILGKNWTVRRVKRNYSEDWTEITAERGTYDA